MLIKCFLYIFVYYDYYYSTYMYCIYVYGYIIYVFFNLLYNTLCVPVYIRRVVCGNKNDDAIKKKTFSI